MTAICEQCRHYRPTRPASQLLAAAMDVAEGAVANALAKIVEDEQKWLESEATEKRGRANSTDDVWPARPVMSPYCALRETEGQWLIPEIHNQGGRCTGQEPLDAARRACRDCAHRRQAPGPADDARREDMYADMLVGDTMAQAKTSSSDESLLTRHREAAASVKALELSGAYAAKGILLREPRYLDWCAMLSDPPNDFAVCVLANPYARCQSWAAATARATAEQPAAVRPAAAQPEPADGDVLCEEDAGEIVTMMMWLLEIELSPAVQARARVAVIELWRTDERARQFVLTVCLPLYQQCATMPEGLADMMREQAQPGLVAALRTSESWPARLVVSEYDRVNAPLAAGDPPLTREIADAFVDVLGYLEAVASGAEPAPPPPDARAAWVGHMVQAWPNLAPGVRAWLSQMPIGWAQLRYQWETLPPDQRYAYQQQLRMQLGLVQTVAQQVAVAAGPAPAAPAPSWTAYPAAARVPQMPAWAAAGGEQGPAADELLMRVKSRQEAQEQAAEQEDPRLALQVKMHNQMERAALVSNMMSMEHESIMSIIKNIK